MTAKLAEICRDEPLKFFDKENDIFVTNTFPSCASKCVRDAFLGLFFDGTNNNKYRDLTGRFTNSASNVARLFEAFSGNAAEIKPTYGGKPDRPLPIGVADGNYSFHRKVYIPGLGTGFPEIRDPGENLSWEEKIKQNKVPTGLGDKTRGLAMAMHGEARIRWGLLQVLEQVHRMFKGGPLIEPAELSRWASSSQDDSLIKAAFKLFPATGAGIALIELLSEDFDGRYAFYLEKLSKALSSADRKKVRSVRLSIFGFSRGAAEARAFVNRLQQLAPSSLGGVPYQIDFLGIFDTVASVGLANLTPGSDGHMAWADGDAMKIPSAVKRCVHLVAAHEIRRCFPLDSVAVGGSTPSNCIEHAYPGVHSDVGGGYPPRDQGRCKEDGDKISQISLAQMYREARMMGVPLVAANEMPSFVADLFVITPELRKTFNAYIQQTMSKALPITDLLRQQYAFYLAWRKHRLNDIIPRSWLRGAETEAQDIYDIKQANEILKTLELDGSDREYHRIGMDLWRKAKLDSHKDQAILNMFDLYVHDSRAWFKFGGATDDEWFGGGKSAEGKTRQSEREKKLAALKKERIQLERQIKMDESISEPSADGRTRQQMRLARNRGRLFEIDQELKEGQGQPLVNAGVASQENVDFKTANPLGAYGAGYLTIRDIYTACPPTQAAKPRPYINPESDSAARGVSYPAVMQR